MKHLEDRNQSSSRGYGNWSGDMVKVTIFGQDGTIID